MRNEYELPKDVITVRDYLRSKKDDRIRISEKLCVENLELVHMWTLLESRKVGVDELWVWSFIDSVIYATNLPKFHYMNKRDRHDLSEQVSRLASNHLDRHWELVNRFIRRRQPLAK